MEFLGTPTSLINLMAIQLLPPSTNSSNRRGASGRKSLGRLHPSSHTTLTMAAVTLGSSSGAIRRSLICGHAALSVSGYTKANLYNVTIVFFRIEGLLDVSRGKRSESVDRARDGLMTWGSTVMGSIIVVADGEAKSCPRNISYRASAYPREKVQTFLIKFVASIRTSVSGRKLWTAARYPIRFCWYLAEDMTSRTLKDAHDMSWPIISR